VKSQLRPLLIVTALFQALGIHRDKESRDHRERSAPEFSHRLLACLLKPSIRKQARMR
jgi:hypothetical protein